MLGLFIIILITLSMIAPVTVYSYTGSDAKKKYGDHRKGFICYRRYWRRPRRCYYWRYYGFFFLIDPSYVTISKSGSGGYPHRPYDISKKLRYWARKYINYKKPYIVCGKYITYWTYYGYDLILYKIFRGWMEPIYPRPLVTVFIVRSRPYILLKQPTKSKTIALIYYELLMPSPWYINGRRFYINMRYGLQYWWASRHYNNMVFLMTPFGYIKKPWVWVSVKSSTLSSIASLLDRLYKILNETDVTESRKNEILSTVANGLAQYIAKRLGFLSLEEMFEFFDISLSTLSDLAYIQKIINILQELSKPLIPGINTPKPWAANSPGHQLAKRKFHGNSYIITFDYGIREPDPVDVGAVIFSQMLAGFDLKNTLKNYLWDGAGYLFYDFILKLIAGMSDAGKKYYNYRSYPTMYKAYKLIMGLKSCNNGNYMCKDLLLAINDRDLKPPLTSWIIPTYGDRSALYRVGGPLLLHYYILYGWRSYTRYYVVNIRSLDYSPEARYLKLYR